MVGNCVVTCMFVHIVLDLTNNSKQAVFGQQTHANIRIALALCY